MDLKTEVKQDIANSKDKATKGASVRMNADSEYTGSFSDWGEDNDYISYDKTFTSMKEFADYADAFLKLK